MTDVDARSPGVSIVLPCHDEEATVLGAVGAAHDVGRRTHQRFEVIVVDDGSTDATPAVAAEAAARFDGVRVVSHVRTRGYGAALRTGLAAARLPYVLLVDGELDIEPAELGRFVAHAGEADLLVGYRVDGHGRSTLRWPSRVRSRVARALFGLPVRDPDCPVKLIRRDVLAGVELSSANATVGTELVARCLRAGASVRELGVATRRRASTRGRERRYGTVRELLELRHVLGS
jgi:glycosyltransferase involved in cell wall biosynthesis